MNSAASKDLEQGKFWPLLVALVLAVSAFPYINALSGTPVWDDPLLLSGEVTGQSHGLAGAVSQPFMKEYFRPVASLSFQIGNLVHGPSPFFHHLTNLVVHLLTVLAVIGCGVALFCDRLLGLLSGAIYGALPMQVGAIAWIGGRTDALAALFIALFFLFLLLSLKAEGKKLYTVLGCASLLLAMGCKEPVALALVLVPLTVVTVKETRLTDAKSWLTTTGIFAIPVLVFLTAWYLSGVRPEKLGVNDLGKTLDLTGRTLWHYVTHMFVPTPGSMNTYTLAGSRASGTWPVWAGLGAMTAMVGLAVVSYRRRSIAAVSFLAIILFLLPISNVLAIPSLTVAPYRPAVAGPFVALLLAAAVAVVPRARRTIGLVLACAYIVTCIGMSRWGSDQWRSEKSLFETMAQYDKGSTVSVVNFAVSPEVSDAEAIKMIERALDWIYGTEQWKSTECAVEILDKDSSVTARANVDQSEVFDANAEIGKLFRTLGTRSLSSGEQAIGEKYLRTATLIDPNSEINWAMLARLNALNKNFDEAQKCVEKSIAIKPDNAMAMVVSAMVLESKGDLAGAESALKRAMGAEPYNLEPYLLLVKLLSNGGRKDEARQVIESAVSNAGLEASVADNLIQELN